MAFLLDTNVLSEVVRPRAEARVLAWLRALPPTQAFISVLLLGEIAKGVALVPPGPRKVALRAWVAHDLPDRFRGRVLNVDTEVAEAWGELAAEGQRIGRPLPAIDGLLLATARAHGLTLATRNVRDCGDRGVPVFDPWSAGG